MIRIPVTRQEMESRIEREVPGWLERAAKRTRQARQRKRFTGEGLWSEVKGVYMTLQRHKCAYCERPMAEGSHANIEYDVEHFRPKSRVTTWPDPETTKALRIRYKVRSGNPKGYPLLAHDPHNYVVTCKVCNTPLKADHFPIEGTPSTAGSDIAKLDAEEKPLLIYPLGMTDPGPEELITFEGILPVPAKRGGHDRKRAQVTIDFFRLHLRTELRDARAHLLVLLWEKFQRAQQGTPEQRRLAREVISAARHSSFPHSGCARAFLDLCERQPVKAKAYYLQAHEIMSRKEPGLYGAGTTPHSRARGRRGRSRSD